MHRIIRAQSDYKSTLLRNQLTSLVLYEAITTTESKAKALSAYANHFFNKVRGADLTAKKLAHATLLDKNAIKKVFEEVLPRFKNEETTFVKSIKAFPRRGDNAAQRMVLLTATLKIEEPKKEAKTAKAKKKVEKDA